MALTLIQKLSVTSRVRGDWYEALGKTAKDDLPLFEVLGRMQGEFDKTKHPLGPVVRELLFRLKGFGAERKGAARRTLGTELRGLVPDNEAMLIQAGVMSGDTSGGLYNAAELVAKQGRLMSAVMGSLFKPLGYFLALVGLLLYFSLKLLPSIAKNKPRTKWPPDAQLLGWVADHIWLVTGGMVGGLLGFVVFIGWLAPRWTGPRREWFDRHVFPFTLIGSINGASLLTSLAGYISAGVPFNDALANIKASASPYMAWQSDRLMGLIKELRPEAALVELSIIQPRYHWIIKVYGMGGDATHAYRTIAEEMTTRTEQFIRNLFDTVIGNLLLLAVGVAVMWIYFAMFAIVDSGSKKAALETGLPTVAALFQPSGVHSHV